MAKKERQKRSARQARQQERAERASLQAATLDATREAADKGPLKAQAKRGNKLAKAKKPGRVRSYLSAVRSELKRVTWPTRPELVNYSVATIVMLVVVGVAVWLVDLGFVNLFNLYTGLRAVIGNG
ncbi:preprotein translocase subunit SecE [Olsenella sp. HMSC062G07]|uniref:preprotein translocase subunit SecE n=1 Tax=Olsenella sp. HMSC062G07 TaxID=1739330 RepID=UPI0008A261DA|nr:preprotein translocase subunit SecE [Olsenella sp. HMSC062G07]OFK22679.1 preprotein translocase subunit SecE [Olsenella sp. HMSC062G07]